MTKKEARGRPLLYNNCVDLDYDCEMYFLKCDYETDEYDDLIEDDKGNYIKRKEQIPYTITGLAMDLNTSRRTLLNYELREDFSGVIQRHKLRVENYSEIRLHTKKQATGPIFALKNFGWSDNLLLGNTGGEAFETKSTLETGQGLSATLAALERAATTRENNGDEGDNQT